MKAFTYRLQRVLDVRQAATSRCETQLAASRRKLEDDLHQQESCRHVFQQSTAEHMKTSMQEALSARDHRLRQAWTQHLVHCLDQAAYDVSQQTQMVDRCREELQTALTKEKVMERLSNRERQAWMRAFRKQEQNMQDEQAGMAYSRGQRSRGVTDHTFGNSQQEDDT